MMKFLLFTVVSALTTLCAHAYSNGLFRNSSNPMEALNNYCTVGNLRPNHGDVFPKTGICPYKITLHSPSGNVYTPGKPVKIKIEPRSPRSGLTIKGFVIQGDSTETTFGGKLTCAVGKEVHFCNRRIVTHKEGSPKPSIECTWTPPDYQIGSVRFIATIVKDFTTFWSGVSSQVSLKADNKTMTYGQKTQQMREEMMRGATNLMGQLSSAMSGAQAGGSNPFASLMSKMGTGAQGANPFAALMTKNTAGQAQAGQQGNDALAAMMRNFGGAQSQGQAQAQAPGNPWASLQTNYGQYFQQ